MLRNLKILKLLKIVKKITPHTYKIVLDEAANRFDVVHMEQLKEAQIPIGSNPEFEITHYNDDVYTPDNVFGGLFDENEDNEDHQENDNGSASPDEIEKMLNPQEREKTRRRGLIIKVPQLRRTARVRTPHIPYQHSA